LIEHLFLFGNNNVEYEREIYASVSNNNFVAAIYDPKTSGSEIYLINSTGEVVNSWSVEENFYYRLKNEQNKRVDSFIHL
jgi:hypothetical protein